MLTQVIVWLGEAAGRIGDILLAPLEHLPGWGSATLVAAATGLVMLVAFKYTSNQAAIRRARSSIKANLLSLSLFKDSVAVGLRAQGRILLAAGRLLLLSVVPMLVLLVPMSLALAQLALRYQWRPLRPGEEAVVTVRLAESAGSVPGDILLAASPGVARSSRPVRVPRKGMVCWEIRAGVPGLHELSFEVCGRSYGKELRVGEGFAATSQKRPAWEWSEALLHPRERPFAADSPVQSIEIAYPERESLPAGTDTWLVYWFVVSMGAALAARPVFKVSI